MKDRGQITATGIILGGMKIHTCRAFSTLEGNQSLFSLCVPVLVHTRMSSPPPSWVLLSRQLTHQQHVLFAIHLSAAFLRHFQSSLFILDSLKCISFMLKKNYRLTFFIVSISLF